MPAPEEQPPVKVSLNSNDGFGPSCPVAAAGGFVSDLSSLYDLNHPGIPQMTLKERKQKADKLGAYLLTNPPDYRYIKDG